MRRWRVAVAVVLAAALAGGQAALAGGQARAAAVENKPRPVVVVLPDCLTESPDAVRRLLAVELGSALVDEADGALRVTAACKAGKVLLELRAPDGELTMARAVDLDMVAPEARVRVLSLAIGELVAAARNELAHEPAVDVLPPPGIVAAAPPRPLPWRFSLLVGGRHFGTPGYWAFGPGLVAERSLGRFAVAADLFVEQGSATASLGAVEVTLASAGAALLMRRNMGRLRLEGGVGARGGIARLRGEPDSPTVQPDSHTAVWGGPVVTARVVGPPSGRLVFGVAMEAGYAVLDVGGLVNGAREVAVDGAWITIQLGVGVRL